MNQAIVGLLESLRPKSLATIAALDGRIVLVEIGKKRTRVCFNFGYKRLTGISIQDFDRQVDTDHACMVFDNAEIPPDFIWEECRVMPPALDRATTRLEFFGMLVIGLPGAVEAITADTTKALRIVTPRFQIDVDLDDTGDTGRFCGKVSGHLAEIPLELDRACLAAGGFGAYLRQHVRALRAPAEGT